jgi:hypothetical protein
MAIPKNYFQDRLVLLLLSFNFFFTVVTSLLILFRLDSSNSEGIVSQYHANLGLSAYKPGSTSTFLSFIGFTLFVLVLNTLLSMRMYHRRREFSIAILWMGLLLLLLALVVSNALSVLQ